MPENEDVQEEVQVPSGDDQLEFNLGEGEQGAEVEITEDGKAEVKQLDAPVVEQAPPKKQADAAEHQDYSDKVKKRLDKMTARLREAERREQAALEYARQVQANLQATQSRVETLDESYLTEFKTRVDSQLAIAEANLQDAVERGDGKAVVEAQKLLSQLVLQQERANILSQQRQAASRQEVAPPVQQYVQPQQPAQQAIDPKAQKWADENEWFGEDPIMTNVAYTVHGQLEQEGFDLSSDEYYDELNRRIRKELPHKFKKPQVNTNVDAPGVAPATRGSTVSQTGRRTIKLTPSEVAIARKLGVPLEEYAKYVRR